jgi:replicative DNA helicase
MNINDLWIGMVGKGSPFEKILKGIKDLKDALAGMAIGIDMRFNKLEERLDGIKTQLDDIEEAIEGTEAARLIVTVGVPEEQP